MQQVDKEFVDLVARDVRGLLNTAEQKELEKPENIDRVYDALNILKKDVEVQLSNQKSRWAKKRNELNGSGDDGTEWIAYRAGEADWRARAIKFLTAVEAHLAVTKARRRSANQGNRSADELLDEIFTHMEEIGDEEASDADRRIWKKAQDYRQAQ